MAITTKTGEIAYADSVSGLWRSISPMDGNSRPFGWLLERTNLFNNDTAFTSGFIENEGKYDVIYRTEDGGKSWSRVNFGQDGWIDAAVSLSNGEAWMAVAGKGVAHTADFGKTWETAPSADLKQRYTKMFCNSKREGIMGSVWNSLGYSSDNGKSWIRIATPLDQKKYDKTNPDRRPELDGVTIFKNYFLVKQENMVFVSEKNPLDWKYIRNIEDFYADPEHDDLYLRLKDKSIIHVNERLDTAVVGNAAGVPFSGTCVNGNLYLLTDNNIVCIAGNKSMQQFPVLRSGNIVVEPQPFRISPDKYEYGIAGSIVYKRKLEKDEWKPMLTLAVSPDVNTLTFSPQKNEIAFEVNNDSIYHVDINNGKMRVDRKGAYLSRFQHHAVSRVIVSTGSQGCFHGYSDNLEYERDGKEFVLMDNNAQGTEHTRRMASSVEVIAKDEVDRLVKAVCNDPQKLPVMTELGFTQKDYEQCKKDIQAFNVNRRVKGRPGSTSFYIEENNVDFNKLISLVDSIQSLDSAAIGKILLNSEHMFSTTTNWMSVTLVNDNDEVLRIAYSYYEQPNAMRLPCVLSFDEETMVAFTPEITRFMDKNCPALMKDKNRMPLLYDMVKYLYSMRM
ncbi:hypothetical protein HGH92_01840 [Chitinophaga varians]|uniref:Photosynthesis system II assembly factor Ycf48/Hcf136-like domain-containing protein n=1 Tax=Chitinophaga varians TaxID=2202339 RepID=A0A847RIM9_9BACT|nr:hypothetical protein [Chitinophaga varians]NLR63036.1 hypothetical protein [Chitinophaga varians]